MSARRPLDHIEMFDGLDHPEGIAVTPDGLIFVGGEAGQIYRIDDDDTATEVANTGGFILGIAADAAGRSTRSTPSTTASGGCTGDRQP